MSDLELMNFIIEKCKEHNITAYEIGKNTHLSTFAVQRILKGETKKPYRGTLMQIVDYLEGNLLATNLPIEEGNKVQEPSEAIRKETQRSEKNELMDAYKKQIYLFEKNMDLYEENADLHREATNLLREKIHYLEAGIKLS